MALLLVTPTLAIFACAFVLDVGAVKPMKQHNTQIASKRAIDAMDTMWAGDDLPTKDVQFLRPAINKQPAASVARAHAEPVVLLGPMDSGTHLLTWMLEKNFPEDFGRACQGSFEGCKWIWKHSLGADDIVKVLNSSIGKELKNTNIIAVVRSPFGLLEGWRKDPWDMKDCAIRPFADMAKPCSARLRPSLPESHSGLAADMVPSLNFSSTMDIINRYYAQYENLQRSGLFKNVLVVRYEDLILAPAATTKLVGSRFGWREPLRFLVAETSVKRGVTDSREQAITAVRNKEYLDKIPRESWSILCGLLNQTAKSKLKLVEVSRAEDAGGDPSLAPHYMSDCMSDARPPLRKPWWKRLLKSLFR